jgi:hypothetical protein
MRSAFLTFAFTCMVCGLARATYAQLAPEIGYVHPSGGQAGTTREVVLGGYDWTPDMQLFVHDPRIKLELIGPPGPVLVPEPPYWFGAKARGPAWPLPRELKARLTIPADVPPGLVRWQAANANGASPPAVFHVGGAPEIAEDARRKSPQVLPALPVTVSGQIRLIEEIDQYQLSVPKTGPVTIELLARRLSAPWNGMLQVREAGAPADRKPIVDVADTEGRDLMVTFLAQAGVPYVVSLHDLDFAGDRSYVYRLLFSAGPSVLAAYPSAGRRGETRKVEFVGIGIATGAAQLETLVRDVTLPATGAPLRMASASPGETRPREALEYRLETPHGAAPLYPLLLSDVPEHVETAGPHMTLPPAPCAVTASIETRFGSNGFAVNLTKDKKWRIAAQARSPNQPLDLELRVLGPEGKEVGTLDDEPGSTDASLLVAPAADGVYQITVTDRSGRSGTRASCYRLSVEAESEGFSLSVPTHLSLPLGAKANLVVKTMRTGGFAGAIPLTLAGLPTGVTAPPNLSIPADKAELAVELTCAADAPANASLCSVSAAVAIAGQAVSRQGTVLLATVMKPRCKITPEGLDDVRKVHRGSTFLAPVLIERLEGYQGEVVLEMTSKQQRHRQGLASDEMTVPAAATRVEYPIFVPEWMETTKTSRMILNGVVKVADPRGSVRTLVHRMELRIGILPEGALLKLAHAAGEPSARPGAELKVPVNLSRAPGFRESVRIEIVASEDQSGLVTAAPLVLAGDQTSGEIAVRLADSPRLQGEQSVRLRATAEQGPRRPVISETSVLVTVTPAAK